MAKPKNVVSVLAPARGGKAEPPIDPGRSSPNPPGSTTEPRAHVFDAIHEARMSALATANPNNGANGGELRGHAPNQEVDRSASLRPLARYAPPSGTFARTGFVAPEAYPVRFASLVSEEESFITKNRAIRSIEKTALTTIEYPALLSFVASKMPLEDGSEDLKFLSLKNDILINLIQADPLPEDLGGLMLSMVADESEGPVWREYVLQYFGMYYRAKWPLENEGDNESRSYDERVAMQRTLAAALFHQEAGLGGTALIVVEDLATDYPEFQGSALARGARYLATAKHSGMASRVTAISMLGEEPTAADIDLAAELVDDASEELAVRIAATGRLVNWSNNQPRAMQKLQMIAARSDADKGNQRLKEIANRRLAGRSGENSTSVTAGENGNLSEK